MRLYPDGTKIFKYGTSAFLLDVHFEDATVGNGTFSGAQRWYRNSSGILDSVTAGSPRYQHGIGGTLRQGILLERASTSYLIHNTDFATGWTLNNVVSTSTSEADVFGGTSATNFREDSTASANHNFYRDLSGTITDNSSVCLWALVKNVDVDYVYLMLRTKNNSFSIARFNITADDWQTTTTADGTTGTVRSHGMRYFGDDYHLIWASFDAENGGTALRGYLGMLDSTGANESYTGAGSRSFTVASFSGHEGTYPQMHYDVGSSTVSKTADSLTFLSAGQPANGFYVNVEFYGRDTSLLSGTPATRYLYESGDFSIRLTDNDIIADFNGNQLTHTETLYPDSLYKVAVGKDASGMYLYVDGVLSTSNTGVAYQSDISPNTIYIGSDSSAANHADLPIKKVAIGNWSAT